MTYRAGKPRTTADRRRSAASYMHLAALHGPPPPATGPTACGSPNVRRRTNIAAEVVCPLCEQSPMFASAL